MGWPWAQVAWLNARGRANRFSTLKDANRTVIACLLKASSAPDRNRPAAQLHARTNSALCIIRSSECLQEQLNCVAQPDNRRRVQILPRVSQTSPAAYADHIMNGIAEDIPKTTAWSDLHGSVTGTQRDWAERQASWKGP